MFSDKFTLQGYAGDDLSESFFSKYGKARRDTKYYNLGYRDFYFNGLFYLNTTNAFNFQFLNISGESSGSSYSYRGYITLLNNNVIICCFFS